MIGTGADAVARAFREEWGRVVAAVIAQTGNWDVAEESAQEAFARAAARWPREGVPDRPGAWLTTTARNHARTRFTRSIAETAALERRARLDAGEAVDVARGGVDDHLLRLIFTACHPALPLEGRVALTLRTVAGLTTAQLARAFLVPEPTMAQRLVRAKRKIRHAGIPYRVPPAHLLAERTTAVLGVVYLLFNQGYSAAPDDDGRRELCEEAVHLARTVSRLLPAHAEARGLLALLLLQHARSRARTDAAGDLVPLDEQDRTRWSAAAIGEGLALLPRAAVTEGAGPYRLQAEIAACHAVALDPARTDWSRIATLYERLAAVAPTPVVALNRAVAIGMADGPALGLAHIDHLEASGTLDGYHLLPAAKADLLRRLGDPARAAVAFHRALELAPTEPERRFIRRRLNEMVDPVPRA